MQYDSQRPLVVQTDRSILVEAQHDQFEEVRSLIHAFAELVKSPEYIHTYQITPLSLWNAAASGWQADDILHILNHYAKFPLAQDVQRSIRDDMNRFGRFDLQRWNGALWLTCATKTDLERLTSYAPISACLRGSLLPLEPMAEKRWAVEVDPIKRGDLKQQSMKLGYPIQDEAGYEEGATLPVSFVSADQYGNPFCLRDYQQEALAAFHGTSSTAVPSAVTGGGHGVLVLPCGAGKTVIGMGAIVHYQCETLVLTTNTTAVKQWKRELLEKTNVREEDIGEYTGDKKHIRPITITTYQMLTYRGTTDRDFIHMGVFQQRKWGLIVYDEVHLLPAPVFRATASIQSTRRLGLTATLVREDQRQEDVFSLIGPKRYEVSWKQLEQDGYIARAYCTEVRVDFDDDLREEYYRLPERNRARLAQENPHKTESVKKLLQKHEGQSILIIGQYVDQLEQLGALLRIPVITGKMKQSEREDLYERFRQGQLAVLAVSKVANFAIDLPDAQVAIQISGTFGSRQEEAQRLGRILRPKDGNNEAFFYHIVTKDSKDEHYAAKRQLFLVEQGYHYQLLEA